MLTKPPLIAIVWAPHERRSESYAACLDAPLYHIHYLQYKRPLVAPIKYIAEWMKTWQVLFRVRPRVVYVTNPPPFAALCVYIYSRLRRTAYVMDTHSPTLYSRKWSWTVPLQRFLARFALMNIVDQDRYKHLFESWGAKAIVLERPCTVPFTDLKNTVDPDQFDVTVINTFAADEPLDIILDAAKQLPAVRFFILGDTARANRAVLTGAPKNVTFTGYLLGRDYWNRLCSSRAIMALTTYEYSLLGGGQEAMALSKPLILSNQPVLTEFFTKGTVFVENTAEGIVAGVQAAQQREQALMREMAELKTERTEKWQANFQRLKSLMTSAAS